MKGVDQWDCWMFSAAMWRRCWADSKALPRTIFADGLAGVGGFQGVLNLLQQSGLGDRVNSWLSTNAANLPVTRDEITAALGDQRLQALAQKFGIPMDQVAALLSQHLPAAVDQASPDGTLNA